MTDWNFYLSLKLLHDPEARAQRWECINVLSVRRFLWKSTYSYWYYYSTLFMYHVAVNKIFCSIIPWPLYWYLHSVHEILILLLVLCFTNKIVRKSVFFAREPILWLSFIFILVCPECEMFRCEISLIIVCTL